MKKILSLALAAMMVVSVLPVAYAADVDYKTGTNVTVVGDGGEYFVTVPASLEPGQTGTVTAYGKWASNHTLKVWTDDEVEVTHKDTGATTKVGVSFAGIESLGNDLEDMNVTESISIDKGDIRFGEWTGTIIYNVDLDDGLIEVTFDYMGSDGVATATITAEEGMTWREFSTSSYDNLYFQIANENHGEFEGSVVAGLAGYLIDENNNLVSPDAVIDPSAHYETYYKNGGGSPSFGETAPTWA